MTLFSSTKGSVVISVSQHSQLWITLCLRIDTKSALKQASFRQWQENKFKKVKCKDFFKVVRSWLQSFRLTVISTLTWSITVVVLSSNIILSSRRQKMTHMTLSFNWSRSAILLWVQKPFSLSWWTLCCIHNQGFNSSSCVRHCDGYLEK